MSVLRYDYTDYLNEIRNKLVEAEREMRGLADRYISDASDDKLSSDAEILLSNAKVIRTTLLNLTQVNPETYYED